jgi:hypothetical protein
MMKHRDRIAKLLMTPDAYTVPSPWPMPPGHPALQQIPPEARDTIERPAVMQGYDRNAIQGDDLLQQYFDPYRALEQSDL